MTKVLNSIIIVLFSLIIVIIVFTSLFIYWYHPHSLFQLAIPSPSPMNTVCNPSGVQKNSNGAYTLTQLTTDPQGSVVSFQDQSCVIHLLGVNQGGLFLGHAGHPGTQAIIWEKNALHGNIVREALNAYWFNTDIFVPDQNIHFQQWLDTVIHWEEQQGNYVILDLATQFRNPPCGGKGNHTPCPSQNQANKNIPLDPTEKSDYQPTALVALTALAKKYGTDPAVIFDVWNEPSKHELTDEQTFINDMAARIQTVKTYAPNSIIMVYERALDDSMSRQYTTLPTHNILIDSHIYSSQWQPQDTLQKVTYAHQHGQAFIIGEWGGKPGQPSPAKLIPFLQTNNISATYFDASNLVNNADNPTNLNVIGQSVASGYQSIFSGINEFTLPQSSASPANPPSKVKGKRKNKGNI